MPFKEKNELPPDPSVRIYLTGQLILQPDSSGDTCEVFVNRSAPNHRLSIEVREKQVGRPDSILMRHHGPLEFARPIVDEEGATIYGLLLLTESSDGVSAYHGPATPEGESLNLAIKLHSAEFHPNGIGAVDDEAGRPSIFFSDATFYTAAKTAPELKIDLVQGTTNKGALAPFTSLIGANVYLEPEEELQIIWREMGLLQVLTLERPAESISYEIYIINDPLFEDPDEPKVHDEFREYYKLLPQVPREEQFKLDVKFPSAKPAKKGTTKTPCMPVIGDDT